ncbi:restriction endonuclease subunit S [Tenacibaculum sp. nBUS_03]|uniref:restriction endonuclease subunit S n=1 Tax=Tenacibaculum sp. nBUS_03 TaxID=3395320 RepID=UPI003EB8770C
MALGLTPQQIIDKQTHPLLNINKKWRRIELQYIAKIQNGYAFSSKLFNHTEGLPLIRIRDIFSDKTENLYSGEYKDEFIVNRGDILIGMDGDFKVSKWPGKKGLLNQRVCRVLFNTKNYNENFLFLCLQPYLDAIHSETSAVTVKHLSSRTIQAIPLPLPPLIEQQAIVKKIEGLLSSLDHSVGSLTKAQEQLKIYRQAVLKKAFEGELTKEWRSKQTDLPTADELLAQIQEEREKHYEKQVADWKKEVKTWEEKGKEGKKPAKPRPLTIPDEPNKNHNEKKWEIPKNWIWTQFGLLCFVTKLAGFEYTDYVKYDKKGDLSVLKAENVGTSGFRKTIFSKVKSESVKMLTRSQIFGGELLVVFVGAGTGNVAMIPHNQRYFLGPNIGMARPYFDLNSKYLELFFQSALGKSLMMSAVKAVAQPSLSMATIRQAPVAFPLLEEQHQIVKEIESRLSVCDKLEESITTSLQKAKALRQSILKKAFKGTLLTAQEIAACKADPNYEPASVLLEKIKAEKAVKEAAKKTTLKKKPKKQAAK